MRLGLGLHVGLGLGLHVGLGDLVWLVKTPSTAVALSWP